MFTIKVNPTKNRLYLILGTIEPGEAEEIFDELQEKLHSLTNGFSGVFDISNFKVDAPGEIDWVRRIITLLSDAGMGVSARVTGGHSKSRTMIGRHMKPTIVVGSIAKADQILDKQKK